MRVVSIVGARPQFIKAATVSRALRAAGIDELIVHSGQHYDPNMSEIFFEELDLAPPVRYLGVGSDSNARQIGRMLPAMEETLTELTPDMVIVYGDTNTTLAGALAANTLHIPLAHVEAGLRSFNRGMPEELNRVLTDHCAEVLFCPTESSVANLQGEGLTMGVHLVGDVMYDELLRSLPRARELSRIHSRMALRPGDYCLATIHRAQSTDDPAVLAGLVEALMSLDVAVVLPLHPRTRERLCRQPALLESLARSRVRLIEPIGYLDMLCLEEGARVILTDSGGVQKEAFFLKRPCVTLRAETEWPETVASGWNVLAGSDANLVRWAVRNPPMGSSTGEPLFGRGDAAVRIARILHHGSS